MLWAEWQQHYVCSHGTYMQIHACTHPACCAWPSIYPASPHSPYLAHHSIPRDLSLCLGFGRCLGSKNLWDLLEGFRNWIAFPVFVKKWQGSSPGTGNCRTGGLCDLQGHPLTRKGSSHLPWSNPCVLKVHHPAKNMVHAAYKMTTLDKDLKKNKLGDFFQALGSGRK